ncbi:trypsin-like peptidase domain-containing protein [Streptomyces sp. B93]|uniref:VMAP-C domain-containing protein n=1 Tax=Streptomyces sp. B93 TaxID=2824875 RepID=UPI001B3858A3|nr:trypsin-like peptidase domain-containing protein [Streptomyces sp. B93]MBQ1090201.1 trypsin-like peptidase domain-containing protein [Streptomyces sp. B93]
MGWFKEPDRLDGTPSLHVVSVAGPKAATWSGGGFLLGDNTVLTCAHVVNDALGRPPFETRTPGLEELQVMIRRPYDASLRCPARVAHWIPPRAEDGGPVPDGAAEWLGDLAVLRIDLAPGKGVAPPLRGPLRIGQKVRAWHASGRESTFADLTVKTDEGPIAYLDGSPTGMSIGPGYSGGPLWSPVDKAVIGLVTAHFMPPADPATGQPRAHSPQHLIRRSWCVPWQRVEAELRAVGALEEQDPAPVAVDDPAYVLLVSAISDALPVASQRGDLARRLAEGCGVGHGGAVVPPSVEEFAAFLLSHPRALPVLTELLRREERELTQRLLVAGRLSRVPRLLSPREHHLLHQLLRGLDRAVLDRFGEVVRAALPLVAAFPGGETLDALLDHLETLAGDGRSEDGEPRVPALLRVMEYVGVLCAPAQRAGLRLWADGVAARLGIPRSALAERRSDAQEWARVVRHRSTRSRVLVHVTRAEPGRHRLRIWCDEGAGPRQVSTDTTVSYSAREGARELLRVLESLGPTVVDGQRPLVEVLVDRSSLNLPVDEWEGQAPGEIVPGVLGVEFPLVVHCPELLRRHERFLPDWRRRWSLLDSGTTLVVSDASTDPNKVYYELMDRLDTVRVSVDAAPDLRDRVVQICLAVGIPVVVWDRGRGSGHVVKRLAEVATRELPDGVRSYRANTMIRPLEYPGRPVLAWADADRTVPRLHLTEPQEGP